MLLSWPNSSNWTTSTASLALFRKPGFGASLATAEQWLSLCVAAEKNDLSRLWRAILDLLRSSASAGTGSLLWRQACVPRLLSAQGRVSAVRGREDRALGLACRQSAVHQEVRVLRGTTLSRNSHQGSGRRTLP